MTDAEIHMMSVGRDGALIAAIAALIAHVIGESDKRPSEILSRIETEVLSSIAQNPLPYPEDPTNPLNAITRRSADETAKALFRAIKV